MKVRFALDPPIAASRSAALKRFRLSQVAVMRAPEVALFVKVAVSASAIVNEKAVSVAVTFSA